MNLLKKVLIRILIFLIVLSFISVFLPQKQYVERSIIILVPAEQIYPLIASPKLFQQWTPWSKIDPNMTVVFTGYESGKGAGMSWQSDHSSVGTGSWIITDAIENKSLKIAMDFGDQGTASSFFDLEPNGGSTKVTWGFDTDAGYNPIKRWFGLLMDKMVGDEYAKGLATLKKMMEK